MVLAILFFVCFLIANKHVATTVNYDEDVYFADLAAAKEKELDELYEKYSGEQYIGGRLSVSKYYKLTQKNDLGWDVIDFELNHHHPSNYAKRGSHGSKGQAKAKQRTLDYKAAREMKYRYEV